MNTINLGCGTDIRPNMINLDREAHSPGIDMAWDLNQIPYPLPNNHFDKVLLLSVIEHLIPTPLETLDEIWRITRPYGVLVLKFPLASSPTIHDDLTHRWFLSLKAFDVLDPRTERGQQYHFYTAKKWHILDRKTHKNMSAWLTMRKVLL